MARFVVAGKVDCAAYARAEILADQLKTYLPDFHVHKVYTLPLSCYIIHWSPYYPDTIGTEESVIVIVRCPRSRG